MLSIAGTGDHTFERRLRLGGPLLKENIATMVLERLYHIMNFFLSNLSCNLNFVT